MCIMASVQEHFNVVVNTKGFSIDFSFQTIFFKCLISICIFLLVCDKRLRYH